MKRHAKPEPPGSSLPRTCETVAAPDERNNALGKRGADDRVPEQERDDEVARLVDRR